MTSVRLEHLGRRFGATVALDDIHFEIPAGELFFLLGPSGCGKSTLLRLIAGLLEPTAGQIFFNDRDVTNLPTQDRNAVMCFQSYALWPHMTVAQNIRFGLDIRDSSAAQRENRLKEVLKLVQLESLSQRKPNALSGGQQQRVALARALAVQPACLLLDEPLSNLDAKLRLEMRSEIRRVCKSSGLTTVYVTHDQKEALSIADRIAVMKDGKVIQIGSPSELYAEPRNSFVADFLGQTNLIPGMADAQNRIQTPLGMIRTLKSTTGKIILSIRPEKIRLTSLNAPPNPDINRFPAKIIESSFLGDASEHIVQVGQGQLKLLSNLKPPNPLAIEFDPADAIILSE
jgi:iron(III) transport system ATP-binding protein